MLTFLLSKSGTILKALAGLLIIVAVIFLTFTVLPSCKSFTPVEYDDRYPAECNMALNIAKLHYDSKEKSGTVPSFQNCFTRLKSLECQEEVFGKDSKGFLNRIEHENLTKMNFFLNCLTRKTQ